MPSPERRQCVCRDLNPASHVGNVMRYRTTQQTQLFLRLIVKEHANSEPLAGR